MAGMKIPSNSFESAWWKYIEVRRVGKSRCVALSKAWFEFVEWHFGA